MKEKISYYLWRIERLICLFKHDWKSAYSRETSKTISGRLDCDRCYKQKYFSKDLK